MTATPHPPDGHPDGEESEERTTTAPASHGADEARADEDVLSDPALDDRIGSDWVDEGGATASGPATRTPGPDSPERGDPDRESREAKHEEFGEAGLPQITLDPPD